jgi:hypothetical protein
MPNLPLCLSSNNEPQRTQLSSYDLSDGPFSVKVTQASHGFTTGQPLYFNGTIWVLAEANNAGTLGIGLAIVIDPNTFTLQYAGNISGLSGLTAGNYYFVSDSTAGTLSINPPVALTSFSNPILFTLTTTSGIVLPFRPSQVLSAASYTTEYDFLLDNEPMYANFTYSNTYNGAYITSENWYSSGPTLLKNITYTYTAQLVTTEVRTIYYTDGITIVAQMTINYVYQANKVITATYTRNV